MYLWVGPRRARAVTAVADSQRRAAQLGTAELTLAQINREISTVRGRRKAGLSTGKQPRA